MSAPKLFTFEEIVAGLERHGVGREAAERQARIECGIPDHLNEVVFTLDNPIITLPFRFTLPWSALCSDNTREKASLIRLASGEVAPRKILDARYKLAMKKTQEIVRKLVADCAPLAIPLALHARVYVPDERLHDCCNFAKCCADSLERIIYTNDKWLHRSTWERMGVDGDAPRADLTISRYLEGGV